MILFTYIVKVVYMSKTTFILLGITYYIISVIIIIIVLNKINKKEKKKYLEEINNLERNKNQIISADIMSNLQTVGELVNNDLMQEVYDNLKKRFDKIKKEDIPKLTDNLLKIEDLYDNKKYKDFSNKLADYDTELKKLKDNMPEEQYNRILDEFYRAQGNLEALNQEMLKQIKQAEEQEIRGNFTL